MLRDINKQKRYQNYLLVRQQVLCFVLISKYACINNTDLAFNVWGGSIAENLILLLVFRVSFQFTQHMG